MDTIIPDKLFFKIGEVSALTTLRPSVLRFWENEFLELNPRKTKSGQRIYSKKDIELIHLIKHLLYSEKLTIEGARHRIGSKIKGDTVGNDGGPPPSPNLQQIIKDVVEELRIIRSML